MFPTNLREIKERIYSIDPIAYGKTRNFKSGAITKLSPYISRGVISTKQVLDYVQSLPLHWTQTEKIIQELAWRDYWQQVWIAKGDGIDNDLKHTQEQVAHHKIPLAIINAKTGINTLDEGIQDFYDSGYMHNHMRMYVASVACNVAQCHWLQPAQWMYYHLLDGDWASNALSWQWVAGSNANKKYYANQENINKYFESQQKNTFLDVPYEAFDHLAIPNILSETIHFSFNTELPKVPKPILTNGQKTLIYNYYNLDPAWLSDEDAQRVLLLEPSFFVKYPVSQKCIEFILSLSQNIPTIQVFVGAFSELYNEIPDSAILFKEHPTSAHYIGQEMPRDWMFNVQGYYPSFFSFWKKCLKEIKK